MKHLLPPDILQPTIQIPNLLRNLAQLPLVRALDRARLPNRQVERQLHLPAGGPLSLAQPTPRRGAAAGGQEADAVLARVGGAEGEFARVGAFGVDDAVVVVEDFVYGDGDAEVGVRGEGGVVLGFEGAVVAFFCFWG